MTENKINLQQYAMHAGTYMGVYWIAKFMLFPLGFTYPLLMILFAILTLGVPFLGYFYVRRLREKVLGGTIGYLQSCLFLIFMYLFASLLVAVAHYIYFRYLDNGFIIDTYTQKVEVLTSMPEFAQVFEQYNMSEVLSRIAEMTPIEITMQLLSQNIFYCMIIALITSIFVMRKKKSAIH